MRAWVMTHRGNARAAERFAAALREEGHSVACANSRWYEGEVYKDADVLYHDGSVPDLVHVHERAGITCRYVEFASGAPATEVAPAPEPEPNTSGYTLDYSAPWYTIFDSGGNKVGKAMRDEVEANERLAALNAEGATDG